MKMKNLLMTTIAIFGFALISNAQVPNYVSSDGLIGWWPFNGNANDESLNGNNGINNGATLTTDRFNNINSALSFNGTSNYINVPNNSTLNPNSITISTWINSNANATNAESGGKAIVTKWYQNINCNNLGDNYNLQLNYLNDQSVLVGNTIANNQISNSISSQTNLIGLNTWRHIVFMHDSNNGQKLFIDGVQINSNIITGSLCSTLNDLLFGADNFNGNIWRFFDGKLDDIGIWNRALTECEVKDLYNAQLNSSASIQAGTDVSICEGNDVIFNGSGGSNYTWNNGVQNGVAYIPTISQEYIVIGQDANNCYGTDTIYVELMPNTAATQTQTALDSYTWPINSQTYTQSGTYTAVIPNAAGCDSTITLELSLDFTGLEDNSQGALFSVFPNPAQSAINIKADISIIGEFYTIYDNAGRVVLNGKINSENATIELGNLTRGIYMFSVGENMKQTFKVIKE
jgi:hypothetical protein